MALLDYIMPETAQSVSALCMPLQLRSRQQLSWTVWPWTTTSQQQIGTRTAAQAARPPTAPAVPRSRRTGPSLPRPQPQLQVFARSYLCSTPTMNTALSTTMKGDEHACPVNANVIHGRGGSRQAGHIAVSRHS